MPHQGLDLATQRLNERLVRAPATACAAHRQPSQLHPLASGHQHLENSCLALIHSIETALAMSMGSPNPDVLRQMVMNGLAHFLTPIRQLADEPPVVATAYVPPQLTFEIGWQNKPDGHGRRAGSVR